MAVLNSMLGNTRKLVPPRLIASYSQLVSSITSHLFCYPQDCKVIEEIFNSSEVMKLMCNGIPNFNMDMKVS